MFKWLEERLFIRHLLTKPSLPRGRASWQYFPGFMTFLLIFLQMFTGIALAFSYSFDKTTLTSSSFWNLFLYKSHRIGSELLVFFVALYFLRNFLVGSYKKPRELNWPILLTICFIIWLNYTLGVILKGNKEAASLLFSFLGSFPLLGEQITSLLGVDPSLSPKSLQRIFIWHCVAFPLLLSFLTLVYFWLVERTGFDNQNNE